MSAFANLIHVTFSLLLLFKVDGCVSQLKVIIKGDIVAAKQFGSEATESSEECEDSDIRKQRWTSFQFAEVTDLLKKTLGLKSWKCGYCGVKAVKLEKPMFGWVRKVRPLESCSEVNVFIVLIYSF